MHKIYDEKVSKLFKEARKKDNYNSIMKLANELINSNLIQIYNKNVYKNALDLLKNLQSRVAEGTERYAEILRKEAVLYHKLGNSEKEILHYNLAIEANIAANRKDKNTELYRILGMANWHARNLKGAEKAFRDGYELSNKLGKQKKATIFDELIKDIERNTVMKARKRRNLRKKRKR